MLEKVRTATALLLVNIHDAGEVSAQYFICCPQGKNVSQAAMLFREEWEHCAQALDDDDPDDDWTIDDVTGRMRLLGWKLMRFQENIDVEV